MVPSEKVRQLKGKDKIIKTAFSKAFSRSVNKHVCFQYIRPLKKRFCCYNKSNLRG